MASSRSNVGTIYLGLRASTEGLRGDVERAMLNTQRQLSRQASNLQRIGKQMSLAVSLPIVGAGVAIAKTAGDFEASMNRVGALTQLAGNTSELAQRQLAALENQARELGASTQFTASEAADAMGFLAMAGFNAQNIMGSMPATLDLATASAIDLASAADIMSNVMTGFSMSADQSSKATDILTSAFTGANTNLVQLAQAIKMVGPAAKTVGYSLEETAAILSKLGNAGIQSTMAGTALRGIIVRLLNPTETAAKIFDSLKVKVKDAGGHLRDLTDIVRDLAAANIQPEQLTKLFDVRQIPAMAALLGIGADELEQFTDRLNASEGVAKRVASEMRKGLLFQLKALKSAWQELAITISKSGFLSMLTRAAAVVTDLIRGFSKASPAFFNFLVIVGGVAAAIGPAIIGIGLFTKALSFAVGAIVAATGVSFPMLVVAIGTVAAVWATVATVISTNWDKIQKVYTDWRKKNESVVVELKKSWEAFTGALGDLWDQLVEESREVTDSIIRHFGEGEVSIESVLTALTELTTAGLDKLKDFVKYIEDKVSKISDIFEDVALAITLVRKALGDMAKDYKAVMDFFFENVPVVSPIFKLLPKPGGSMQIPELQPLGDIFSMRRMLEEQLEMSKRARNQFDANEPTLDQLGLPGPTLEQLGVSGRNARKFLEGSGPDGGLFGIETTIADKKQEIAERILSLGGIPEGQSLEELEAQLAELGETGGETLGESVEEGVTKTAKDTAKKYVGTLGRLMKEQFKQGLITPEAYKRIMASEEAGKKAAHQFVQSFKTVMQDGKVTFEEIGIEIANILSNAFANVMEKQLTEIFSNWFNNLNEAGGASGGWGSFLTGLFQSFDKEGYTGNSPGTGGVDGKGGFLGILHPDEWVFKSNTLRNMGRQPVVTGGNSNTSVVFNIQSGVTRKELGAILPDLQRQTIAGVLEANRRGGTFRKGMKQ